MEYFQKQVIALLEEQKIRIQKLEEKLSYQKNVLSIDEVCEYTKLSKSYIYKLTSKSLIPFSNPTGKHLSFSREAIDQWLLRNPVKTVNEIKESIRK